MSFVAQPVHNTVWLGAPSVHNTGWLGAPSVHNTGWLGAPSVHNTGCPKYTVYTSYMVFKNMLSSLSSALSAQ